MPLSGFDPGTPGPGVLAPVEQLEGRERVAFVTIRRETLHLEKFCQRVVAKIEIEQGAPELEVRFNVGRPARHSAERAPDGANRRQIERGRAVWLQLGSSLERPLGVSPGPPLDLLARLTI